MWRGIIDKYREFLPVTDKTPIISLNEGNTPLIYAQSLSEKLGKGKTGVPAVKDGKQSGPMSHEDKLALTAPVIF